MFAVRPADRPPEQPKPWPDRDPSRPYRSGACGQEKPSELPDVVASWDAAMEVGLVSCARLGASWLFVGRIEDDGGVLLVAVLG